MCRKSTSCNDINGYNRAGLYRNHLKVLSRGGLSCLNLSYQLGALLNHMIHCAAIPACHSGVPIVGSQMPSLVTIVTHELVSASPNHAPTASRSTSSRGTPLVTITIVTWAFRVHPVSIIGATLILIMTYRFAKITVGVLSSLSIPLQQVTVLRSVLTCHSAELTIENLRWKGVRRTGLQVLVYQRGAPGRGTSGGRGGMAG